MLFRQLNSMRSSFWSMCQLELEPADKLNDARVESRVHAAEVRRVDVETRPRRSERDVTDEKVRAVQEVECFRTYLKSR